MEEAAEYADQLLAPYPHTAAARRQRVFGELMEWLAGHPLSMRLTLPLLDTIEPGVLLGGLRGTTPSANPNFSGNESVSGGDDRSASPPTSVMSPRVGASSAITDGVEKDRLTSLPASITYSIGHLEQPIRKLLCALSLLHGVADEEVLQLFSNHPYAVEHFRIQAGEADWKYALRKAYSVGLLSASPESRGRYSIHPALPAYLARDWRFTERDDYPRQHLLSVACMLNAYALRCP